MEMHGVIGRYQDKGREKKLCVCTMLDMSKCSPLDLHLHIC